MSSFITSHLKSCSTALIELVEDIFYPITFTVSILASGIKFVSSLTNIDRNNTGKPIYKTGLAAQAAPTQQRDTKAKTFAKTTQEEFSFALNSKLVESFKAVSHAFDAGSIIAATNTNNATSTPVSPVVDFEDVKTNTDAEQKTTVGLFYGYNSRMQTPTSVTAPRPPIAIPIKNLSSVEELQEHEEPSHLVAQLSRRFSAAAG